MIAVAMTVVIFADARAAFSQSREPLPDPRDRILTRLLLRNVTIRDALKIVLEGQSFSVARSVHGRITVTLRKISTEEALRKLLDQVDATYRFNAGAYEIIPRTKNIGFL